MQNFNERNNLSGRRVLFKQGKGFKELELVCCYDLNFYNRATQFRTDYEQ